MAVPVPLITIGLTVLMTKPGGALKSNVVPDTSLGPLFFALTV